MLATTSGPKDPAARFFACLLAFMGAMGGMVLSGNLVMLVVFWELTSIFSFLLIGYWHHSPAARDGARMALIVTGTGGLCLLAAVLLIGQIVGSYDLDRVLAAADVIRADRLYRTILILVLLGRLHQVGAVPLPLLAAERDGRADAGVGLPALGDDGEGRRVPADPALAGTFRHQRLVLYRHLSRFRDADPRRLLRALPA